MAIQTIDATFLGPQAIPDSATLTNQIAFTAHLPSGVVPTLQVFLNIQHSFDGDLDISLRNPQGMSIDLFTDVGSSNEGFLVNLSDAAPTDIGTATNPKVERKGATMPYTSLNGHMFSYLSKTGTLALRLPAAERDAFIKKYKTKLCEQYGIVQKEYVEAPDSLLENTREL